MPIHLDRLHDEEGRLAALNRYRLGPDKEQAFEKITKLVKSMLDVPVCAVSVVGRDRQWFKSIQGAEARELTRKNAFCEQTIQARGPLLIEDTMLDERFADHSLVTGGARVRAYAGVPLQTPDGFNLGALLVIDFRPRKFTDDEVAVLTQFADIVVRQFETRSAGFPDGLTGVLTRKGVIDAMEVQRLAMQEQGQPCSMAILDIDHLHAINENHGRHIGDQVLAQVAACCKSTLRHTDIFGRMGGDTFAAILPGSTPYETFAATERLRCRVARLAFAETSASVTVTCGIASLRRDENCDLWLAGAEAALFTAKTRGRNHCLVAEKL